MSDLEKINPAAWRSELPAFKEKTIQFFDGTLSKKDYKGFSGKYGSYAQKDGKSSMLRLRMSAGKLTKEKLQFIVEAANKHNVDLIHFTTCQAVQFHNLKQEALFDIMDKALDVDIVTYGGGGDFPRNVMCSPLSGVDPEEYFNVQPYALAMADFLMHYINSPKMPRKLKVGFSGSPRNYPHATYRDLGFVANPDGTFDVYAAGGLGNNPRFGVKVDSHVNPDQILYYAKAMINTFCKYGNYENRGKARTRFMVEALGSEEAFIEAFQKELQEIKENENLTLKDIHEEMLDKEGDGVVPKASWRVLPQKQEGLYTLRWHPEGGSPDKSMLEAVSEAIKDMKGVELRLAPDETAYIVNLTGSEVEMLDEIISSNAAKNDFESSVSCIGSSICQVGVRDSQALLKECLKAVKEANIADGALPSIHISGCPSSCGTHQTGRLGFRGGIKMVENKAQPAFILFIHGNDKQGQEAMGKEVGAILTGKIPEFLVELGKTVEKSGLNYESWVEANPFGVENAAAPYTA